MAQFLTSIFRVATRTVFLPGGWIFFALLAFSVIGLAKVEAGEKIVIGEIEDIILLPWGIKLPARIDTGAAISSLDAQELKVEADFAEFKLPRKHGGKQLRLPIVDWCDIRSSEVRERRPIVEVDMCIGSKRVRTKVNLNNRSGVKYPLLIGRNTLKENFVVDCTRERCSPPSCPEVPSQ
ncbi:MAG: hypothetical protein EHM36_01490 [Deltaproteobacteria bacterium]|nr:MAG: hypothetical protein EHM36_01490 [Deltaproteobacteria bacterium]